MLDNYDYLIIISFPQIEKAKGILKTMRSNRKDEVLIDVHVVTAWLKTE